MRIALQPAFVLHHRPYRESSVIVDFFSKDYGRIALIAKGSRSRHSRARALIQLFIPLLISWQGKGELMLLTAIETQAVSTPLRGNNLLSAFYLNELLVRLLHKHDAYPGLFSLYQETLLHLQQSTLPEITLRLFEKKLLDEIGYGLSLQQDVQGQLFIAENNYRFYPERGFEIVKEEIVADHFIFSGKSLIDFANEQLTTENLRDAKRLMRLALAPLLGNQPLHSRKLFLEVSQHEK